MSHRQASSRLKKGSAKKQHVNSVPKPPLLFSDSEDDLDYEGITREAATTSSSNTAQSPTTRASPPIAVNSSDQPKGDAVKIPTSTINRVNEATPGPSVKQSKDVSTNEPPISSTKHPVIFTSSEDESDSENKGTATTSSSNTARGPTASATLPLVQLKADVVKMPPGQSEGATVDLQLPARIKAERTARNQKYNLNIRSQVVEYAKQEKNRMRIAEHFGIHHTTIRRWLKATSASERAAAEGKTDKYGLPAGRLDTLDHAKRKLAIRKFIGQLNRQVILEEKERASGYTGSREELEPQITEKCAKFWSYFDDFGVPWDIYVSRNKGEKESITNVYKESIKAWKQADPELDEEDLHRLAQDDVAASWATGMVVRGEKLKDGELLKCEICRTLYTKWRGIYQHLYEERHAWHEGEQCPHCKDSVETFSTAALFRRHICRTHDAYVKGTKTIKRRENPTGLTDTTDHLRCSRCLSCITSETQHRVWCAAKRFEVLTKVIAGSCDADHARVRATSLGRIDEDKWRNEVLLKVMHDDRWARRVLESDIFLQFTDLITELLPQKSLIDTHSATGVTVNSVYIIIERPTELKVVTFNEFVRMIVYIGNTKQCYWRRAIYHIRHSLEPFRRQKSNEHIRHRLHRAILEQGTQLLLVPLTTGGKDGQNFGSAVEAMEMLTITVLGMPNLLNTLACSIGQLHDYDSRLVSMFEHAGEIVTSILYATWRDVFGSRRAELPHVIDLAGERSIREFPTYDEKESKWKRYTYELMEDFVKRNKNPVQLPSASSTPEEQKTASPCETLDEPPTDDASALPLNSQDTYTRMLDLVARSGKPREELFEMLSTAYATVFNCDEDAVHQEHKENRCPPAADEDSVVTETPRRAKQMQHSHSRSTSNPQALYPTASSSSPAFVFGEHQVEVDPSSASSRQKSADAKNPAHPYPKKYRVKLALENYAVDGYSSSESEDEAPHSKLLRLEKPTIVNSSGAEPTSAKSDDSGINFEFN